MGYHFFSGNARYSSWSMRVGVLLQTIGVPFETTWVYLRKPDTKETLLNISSSGRVPILKNKDLTIWDSLAIAEYLNARHGDAQLWPADGSVRAIARACVAEMHSSFPALRSELPMNLGVRGATVTWSAEAQADIDRIIYLLSSARQAFGAGGPFLFGAKFGIVDAFYAPVMERFTTYSVSLPEDLEKYRQFLRAFPPIDEWHRIAEAESERIEEFETRAKG